MKKAMLIIYSVGFLALWSIMLSPFLATPAWAGPMEQKAQKGIVAEGQAEVSTQININVADEKTLMTLKRIGPKLAKSIVSYRQENGPFTKPEDILKVKGIGNQFWEENKDKITVETEGAGKEGKDVKEGKKESQTPKQP